MLQLDNTHTHAVLEALPPEAMDTAVFLNNMDQLFDVFNSNSLHYSIARTCAISEDNDNIFFYVTWEIG